jgi:tryptophan synthase alpha chain
MLHPLANATIDRPHPFLMPAPVPTRITRAFDRLKQEGNRGLIAYVTAGDPSPGQTVGIVKALEQGGVDIIELGVPFSDPIADGPIIQRASERALRAGTTLKIVLQILRDLRRESEIPVVIFSYLNPVLRYGFEKFAADAAAAGADGTLLTDLNVEAAEPYLAEMHKHRLDTIFLVSQTTPKERVRLLSHSSSGFVYIVSRTGVTGTRDTLSDQVIPVIERVRATTPLPIAVGFGLSRREHMAALAPHADAAVVGSAIVRLIADNGGQPSLEQELRAFAAELKSGLVAPAMAR